MRAPFALYDSVRHPNIEYDKRQRTITTISEDKALRIVIVSKAFEVIGVTNAIRIIRERYLFHSNFSLRENRTSNASSILILFRDRSMMKIHSIRQCTELLALYTALRSII